MKPPFFSLTPEQEKQIFANLRKAKAEFEAHGGTYCHCGGLIYPGGRHTCTHGGKPLTREEIRALRQGWGDKKEEELQGVAEPHFVMAADEEDV